MNSFVVIGRLTGDPETRYTKEDKPVTKFNLAINNTKEDVTFLPITTFGKIAEVIGKYSKKGDMLAVEGTIKNNDWTDKEGQKRHDYSFLGTNTTFLSTKKGQETTIQGNDKPKKDEKLPNEVFEQFGEIIETNDIPFEV